MIDPFRAVNATKVVNRTDLIKFFQKAIFCKKALQFLRQTPSVCNIQEETGDKKIEGKLRKNVGEMLIKRSISSIGSISSVSSRTIRCEF
jgi:hypothetical protein